MKVVKGDRIESLWRCDCGCHSFLSLISDQWSNGDVTGYMTVIGPMPRTFAERIRNAWSAFRGCRFHMGPEVVLSVEDVLELVEAAGDLADRMKPKEPSA